MNELKIDHQFCIFHLEKNLSKLINKESNKIARKYKANLKKENPELPNTKLNKMRDEKKKEFKAENERISRIIHGF